jgi:hypothetical protein
MMSYVSIVTFSSLTINLPSTSFRSLSYSTVLALAVNVQSRKQVFSFTQLVFFYSSVW